MIKLLFVSIGVFTSISSLAKPQKNYETLISTQETSISKSGDSVHVNEEVYKILTETGRSELSLYKIRYSGADSEFKLLEGFSITNGKNSPVDKADIRTGQVQTEAFGLTDLKEAVVSFNNLAIGSELHVRYQIEQKPSLGTIFSTSLIISNFTLAKKESYRFVSELPLQIYSEGIGTFFSLDKSNKDGKFILEINPTSKAYDFEGVKVEKAIVSVTNATNWKQVNELLAPKYQSAVDEKLPDSIQKIVAQAKTRKTQKEIIEFVANEINKKVAYSGDWSTVAGKMFPAGIQKSVNTGKGDCKDYSTLMTALLRKLGFKANPVLTFRSQSYIGEQRIKEMSLLPSPGMFNHAIVRAEDSNGKVWWVDPTNPYVQADVITSDILGNFGLILDGKSEQAVFLPKENSEPSNIVFEQTLKVAGDNSVTGEGNIQMSPSAYNSFAMTERMSGISATKKIISFILNPKSKIEMDLKKILSGKPGYAYSFHAQDWIEDRNGKLKSIFLFHPVGLALQRIRPEEDADAGELGTFKVITHLKGEKEIDPIRAGCLVRSKWMDFDRNVENRSEEILITDSIRTKIRFISKTDSKGDHFDHFYDQMISCVQNSALVLKLDATLKTPEYLAQEKLKGPAFENMTDKDAENLFEMSGPDIYRYRYLKVYRYFEKKAQRNPKDSKAYLLMARSMVNLGFLKGDDSIPSHLEAGLALLDQSLSHAEQTMIPEISSLKIKYFLFLNQLNEALNEFTKLNKIAPKNFFTYKSAFRIASKQKKYSDAELWLRASGSFAKTESEKDDFNESMAGLSENQKKWKEAISYREAMVQSHPKNPWALHNVARLYLFVKDYDKAIEVEKRAIEISEFGVAKLTLADAYVQKCYELAAKENGIRTPASRSKYEEYLLEAVKYDPRNLTALALLSDYYMRIYQATKDKLQITKGLPYLTRATEVDPKNPEVLKLLSQYRDAGM